MNVRKAVIPAAGWGTRFLPVTKSVPKEMLPLIDRPVIQFAVEEAAASGITDVILVTSANKKAIEDYFDRAFELEAVLGKKGDTKRAQQIKSVADLAHFVSVRQPEQLGLGHAVLMGKAVVGREPFAVLLPDDIIDSATPVLKQLLGVFSSKRASVIAVQKVSDAEVSRYGIIDPVETEGRTHRLRRLVEKPKLEEAPSHLAIIGRYVLTSEVFDQLEKGTPGAIGEIQLTDGINALVGLQSVYAYEYEGTLYDGGTPLGLLKASVQAALKRPDTAADFRAWLKALQVK